MREKSIWELAFIRTNMIHFVICNIVHRSKQTYYLFVFIIQHRKNKIFQSAVLTKKLNIFITKVCSMRWLCRSLPRRVDKGKEFIINNSEQNQVAFSGQISLWQKQLVVFRYWLIACQRWYRTFQSATSWCWCKIWGLQEVRKLRKYFILSKFQRYSI